MFKKINDSAAAADGGSLALFVERDDGEVETFIMIQPFLEQIDGSSIRCKHAG